MNTFFKNIVRVTLLTGALLITALPVAAQEVVMVYASSITVSNSLSQIDQTLTPQKLAREFAKELTEDLNTRLPKEQAELHDALRLKQAYNNSILNELDQRLPLEIRSLTAGVSD